MGGRAKASNEAIQQSLVLLGGVVCCSDAPPQGFMGKRGGEFREELLQCGPAIIGAAVPQHCALSLRIPSEGATRLDLEYTTAGRSRIGCGGIGVPPNAESMGCIGHMFNRKKRCCKVAPSTGFGYLRLTFR